MSNQDRYEKKYNKIVDIIFLTVILLLSSVNLKAINPNSQFKKLKLSSTELRFNSCELGFYKKEFGMPIKDKEKYKEYQHQYYEKNKEFLIQNSKQNYQEHKKERAEWQRKYYQKNKEYIKAREKAYNQTEKGLAVQNKSKKKHIKNNPEKHQARVEVFKALKRGDLLKELCIVCGKEKSHGHHEDYNKPLEVIWLCAQHHKDFHYYKNKSFGFNAPKQIIDYLSSK